MKDSVLVIAIVLILAAIVLHCVGCSSPRRYIKTMAAHEMSSQMNTPQFQRTVEALATKTVDEREKRYLAILAALGAGGYGWLERIRRKHAENGGSNAKKARKKTKA